MSSIQTCRDTSDAVEMCAPLGLYLKAIARLNVSIQLPQMKTPGKSISSWEVMEKLRQAIKPDEFTTLKISKTTLEFIRFEGEVENRSALKAVVARLDSSTVKLSGFPENLRVRAAEAKVPFPTRHDWDSYFRDAKGMDEMKPGERPDTIYVQGLPCKWFADKRRDADRPSEQLVCQAFGGPGLVRRLDIPLLDPYQKDAETSVGRISTFSFSQELTFDVYVQYMEYMGFVKAMDSLRGMKLMLKTPEGRAFTANIKVDFDRSRHLSEESIQRRQQERLKIEALEREREERVLRERLEEEQMREAESDPIVEELCIFDEEHTAEQERIAEQHRLQLESQERQQEYAAEATRKLQATHLLQELFDLVRAQKQKEEEEKKNAEAEEEESKLREHLLQQEQLLREKLLRNLEAKKRQKALEAKVQSGKNSTVLIRASQS
ncbi:hypothetical protein HPB52_002624 [Rhipicephalus sanguineus]|uniref:A-kinase anchor protein 17A n=1 Tax=Rhipicephalus sanguineus TaxID=34632 RepID=A0A9D4T196_RHISA|nr:hypothetical protein HPB52_002624 [Rhipicephalus sanguineus]